MDEGLIKQQAARALGAQIHGNQYAAAREKAQTIVDNMAKTHERELAGWNYLRRVMKDVPPSDEEEVALWELVCRMRLRY